MKIRPHPDGRWRLQFFINISYLIDGSTDGIVNELTFTKLATPLGTLRVEAIFVENCPLITINSDLIFYAILIFSLKKKAKNKKQREKHIYYIASLKNRKNLAKLISLNYYLVYFLSHNYLTKNYKNIFFISGRTRLAKIVLYFLGENFLTKNLKTQSFLFMPEIVSLKCSLFYLLVQIASLKIIKKNFFISSWNSLANNILYFIM